MAVKSYSYTELLMILSSSPNPATDVCINDRHLNQVEPMKINVEFEMFQSVWVTLLNTGDQICNCRKAMCKVKQINLVCKEWRNDWSEARTRERVTTTSFIEACLIAWFHHFKNSIDLRFFELTIKSLSFS